jgi:hypothetical protein
MSYVAVQIRISVPKGPVYWPVTRLAELPPMPMGWFPRDGYSDPNRKHMSDILSCTVFHIPSYFEFFTLTVKFSIEIYVISPVITPPPYNSVWNNNFCHCTARDSSGTHMSDQITGMGKTNRNTSLTCKKITCNHYFYNYYFHLYLLFSGLLSFYLGGWFYYN